VQQIKGDVLVLVARCAGMDTSSKESNPVRNRGILCYILSDVQASGEYGVYCRPKLISVQRAKGGMIFLGISKHEATYG
jgi:hypothetical protein